MKYDLGGKGKGGEWTTVNLGANADIRANLLYLDEFCEDGEVDEFRLFSVYEHLPTVYIPKFHADIHRKLKPDGILHVKLTDAKKAIQFYNEGKLSFYGLNDILFACKARRLKEAREKLIDFNIHRCMWGEEEAIKEFEHYGYRVRVEQRKSWKFNLPSYLPFHDNEKYFDLSIPEFILECKH